MATIATKEVILLALPEPREALEERFKSRSSLVRKVTQDLEVANRTQLDLFAAAGSADGLGHRSATDAADLHGTHASPGRSDK